MKAFVIRVYKKSDKTVSVYSRTNNLKQRVARLKENIESINGRGTAVFERFTPFIGCTLDDVDFEFFKQIDYKEQA